MYLIGTRALLKGEVAMKAETTRTLFVVVDVMKGVAAQAGVFIRLSDAKACASRTKRRRNLDEDDVQVFECRVDEDSFE